MTSTALLWNKPPGRRRAPGSDVIILMRPFWWFRNRFETIASVRAQPGGHGTLLRVTLRTRYFAAGYLALWLAGLLVVNLIVIYQSAAGHASITALPFTLVLPAILVAGLFWGRYLARADGAALLDFIREATGAKDLAPELRSVV